MERLLDAKELAAVLGTRQNTIYELAARQELPSLKVPGVGRRFRESEVTAWLEGCRATNGKEVAPLNGDAAVSETKTAG